MDYPRFVVSLGAVALGEAAQLARIPIALLGRWVKGYQKFSITREDLSRLVANFRKRENGELMIDYEHASESPEIAGGGPVPAAGWLRRIEDQPDAAGILWGVAEFTSRARELIANGEYKYLSPVLNWAARDKATGEPQGITLTSLAMVNRPFLEALPAIQLSEVGWNSEGGEKVGMSGTMFDDLEKLDAYLTAETRRKRDAKGIGYRQALDEMQRENPALFALREALYMKRERGKHGAKVLEWVEGELREVAGNLKTLTQAAMQAHPKLTYGAAYKLVASEHPALINRYEAAWRFRKG